MDVWAFSRPPHIANLHMFRSTALWWNSFEQIVQQTVNSSLCYSDEVEFHVEHNDCTGRKTAALLCSFM